MPQLVSNPHGFIVHRFKLIANRKSQSVGAQGPPISRGRGVAGVLRRPPCFRHRGTILDYHFPCILRGRCRPLGSCGLAAPGHQVVQDTAHDERSQVLQISVFARGFQPLLGRFGGDFRLGECKWSSRFSRLPAHHPYRMTPSPRMGLPWGLIPCLPRTSPLPKKERCGVII